MAGSVINPQVNETTAPFQFDSATVLVGGANLSGGGVLNAPAAIGLKVSNGNPGLYNATGGAALTAQSLYMAQVAMGTGTPLSNLYFDWQAATAVSSTTFAGLYQVSNSTTAVLVASTAQLSTQAGTGAGFKTCPLITPFVAAASGAYFIGILPGAASTITVFTAPGATAATTFPTQAAGPVGTSGQYPWAVGGTSLSTLPTSVNPTLTGAYAMWVGAA